MNRDVLRFICTFFAFLWFSVFPLISFSEEVIIRADNESYPATYMRDEQWQGMDVEFIRELLGRTKLDYVFQEIPFPRSLLQIEQGHIHMIPNLVKNAARSEYMHWLGPNRVTCIGFVVQKRDVTLAIESIDDLIRVATEQQKQIGYLTGASYSPVLDERLNSDAALKKTLYFLPDNTQHREMLRLGRLLGYFYDAFEIQQRMKDPIFAADYEGLALHPYRIEESCTGAYIGVTKKIRPEIYQSMLDALESMKEDGAFAAIHRHWLGEDPDF